MTSSLIIAGDIVSLVSGSSPIRVTECRYSPKVSGRRELRGRYVNSGIDVDWRDCNDFIRYQNPVKQGAVTAPVSQPLQTVKPTLRDMDVEVEVTLEGLPEQNIYYRTQDGLVRYKMPALTGTFRVMSSLTETRLNTPIKSIIRRPSNEKPVWSLYVFLNSFGKPCFDFGSGYAVGSSAKEKALAYLAWLEAGCPVLNNQ